MRLIFFIIILLFSLEIKAQNKFGDFDSNTCARFISDNINYEKIKDSTAVYTFSLKIDVEKKDNILKVKTKVNNPQISPIINNLENFSKNNYDRYLKNGKAKILMRFYLIILSSDYNPKLIDVYKMPEIIRYLFEKEDGNFIDFGAYGIMIDKKTYN